MWSFVYLQVRPRKFPSEEDVSEDWSDVSSTRHDESYLDVLGQVQRNLGDFDDCLDSDTIPFSENEYEKIQVDSDAQTESCAERVSPELADITGRKPERCDSSDQGIDSALGRSLSDRSLDTEKPGTVCHATFRLTTDQVNTVIKKVISGQDVEMRAAGGSTAPALSPQHQGLKIRVQARCENHDVGYASESHSNDEPDNSLNAKPTDGEPNALQAVCENQGISQEDVDAIVLRRDRRPAEPMETTNGDVELDSDSLFPDPTWRHSMTSAYDTSSNCSDGVACANDFETSLDTTVETEVPLTETSDAGLSSSVEVNSDMVRDVHKKVKTLIKSSSQDFYRMTMIETDSEPTSSASRLQPNEECRSGATTDAESELSKSLDLPYDDVPVIVEEDVKIVKSSGISKNNNVQEFPVTNGTFEPQSRNLHKSDSSLSDTSATAATLDEVAAKLSACENRDQDLQNGNRLKSSTEELDSLKDIRLSAGAHMFSNTDGLLSMPNVTNDVVQSLFHQAEALIREGDLSCHKPQRFPEEELKKLKRKSKRKFETASGSLPNTSGSGFQTEESQFSSCDASSEGARSSCDSETDASDFSSSGSDDDHVYHSAILANGGHHSTSSTGDTTLCGSRSLSCSPHKEGAGFLRRKSSSKHRDVRPRSITALYELTSGLDLTQFTTSISEGAIDNLKRAKDTTAQEELVGHKLRRTTSDTLKCYDIPYKHRRRRSKRSGSDEFGKLSSSPKLLHSTPLPSRRDEPLSTSQSMQGEGSGDHRRRCRRSLEREVARHEASVSDSAGECRLLTMS